MSKASKSTAVRSAGFAVVFFASTILMHAIFHWNMPNSDELRDMLGGSILGFFAGLYLFGAR
jgi:hypothetical protein